MPAKAKSKTTAVVIPQLKRKAARFYILGQTGLYIHRMSAKARKSLLIGARKKTAAQRLEIKHDPYSEFRECMLIQENWHEHSHIAFPAMAFKSAMGTAALATPGIRKTDVQRLVFMPQENVAIFGVPKLRIDVVRSSDIARTPDMRTRPFFAQWATEIDIEFEPTALSAQAIANLLSNAGTVCGIGDNRQEKGKGSYGTFTIVPELPKELLDRDAQWEAIQNPEAANFETQELLTELEKEIEARK